MPHDLMMFEQEYSAHKQAAEAALKRLIQEHKPVSLYEPMRYILDGGGKRIRPVLTMMACGAVGGNPLDALYGGLAVEILHNFTLVHDDIMDAADMRRGRQTVHKKWNDSAAILCGDGMMALAFQTILLSPNLERLTELVRALTTGIIEVCEGQAFDLEFQDADNVTLEDYLLMIEKKTAKMLELAVTIGGIIGNAPAEELRGLQQFALDVGLAFQIQDDLLDATAEAAKFGKTIGGDIIEGKKTYLILRALSKRSTMSSDDQKLIDTFLCNRGLPQERVPDMRLLLERYGVLTEASDTVAALTQKAHQALDALKSERGRSMLAQFSLMLLNRNY